MKLLGNVHLIVLDINGQSNNLFDGDAINLFPLTTENQCLLDEILTWKPLPSAIKPEKKPISGNRYQIAVKSVDNKIGLVFNAMIYFQTFNLNYFQFNKGEDIRLKFAQEIKNCTDSFKTDVEVDLDFFKWAYNLIKKQKEGEGDHTLTHWLESNKDKNAYLSYPIQSDFSDTVSQMVKVANSLWHQWLWIDKKPSHLFRFLFSDVSLTSQMKDWAFKQFTYYVSLVKKYSEKAKMVNEEYHAQMWNEEVFLPFKHKIFSALERKYSDLSYEEYSQKLYLVASSLHLVFHYEPDSQEAKQNPNCLYRANSILFRLFREQYIQCLNKLHLNKFSLWKHSDKSPSDYGTYIWNGEKIEFVVEKREGVLYLVNLKDGCKVGRISDKPTSGFSVPPVGLKGLASIKSVMQADGASVSRHEVYLVIQSKQTKKELALSRF